MSDNFSILPTALGAVLGFMVEMRAGGGTTLLAVNEASMSAKVARFLTIADGAKVSERVIGAKNKLGVGIRASDDIAAQALKTEKWVAKNPNLVAKLDNSIAQIERRFAGDKTAITAAGIPFMTITANQILQERHKNNIDDGTDNSSSIGEILITSVLAYGINAIDNITDKFALSPSASKLLAYTSKGLAKVVSGATERSIAKKALLGSLRLTASAAVKMAESAVLEGSTEGLQEAIIIYARKWGTDDFKDKQFTEFYDNDAIKEIIGSTVMGSFIGAGMKGGRISYGTVQDGFSGTKVLYNNRAERRQSENTEQINPYETIENHAAVMEDYKAIINYLNDEKSYEEFQQASHEEKEFGY